MTEKLETVVRFSSKILGSKTEFCFADVRIKAKPNGTLLLPSENAIDGSGKGGGVSDGVSGVSSSDDEFETYPICMTFAIDVSADGFHLTHAKRSKSQFYDFEIWETKFKIADEEVKKKILEKIEKGLKKAKKRRPRKLLVIINPAAGWGRGLRNYRRFAAPVFAVAGVDVKVVVSSSKDDIEEIVQRENLEDFDGLLVGGGDGSLTLVISSILAPKFKRNEMTTENPSLGNMGITMGILPCGSGNAAAAATHMTTNWTTIAVVVALGFKRRIDLISVHDVDRGFELVNVSHLMAGYMNLVNGAKRLDSFRFLGPLRYFVLLFDLWRGLAPVCVKFVRVRAPRGGGVDGRRRCEVKEDEVSGISGCPVCEGVAPAAGRTLASAAGRMDAQEEDSPTPWTDLPEMKGEKGVVMGMNIRSVPSLDIVDPRFDGLHFGDGAALLFCESNRSFKDWMKFLTGRYPDLGSSRYSRSPDFHRHLFTEARIELDSKAPPIALDVDGEIEAPVQRLHLKVHPRAMEVFGVGEIAGHTQASGLLSLGALRAIVGAILAGVVVVICFGVGLGGWALIGVVDWLVYGLID